MSVLTGPAGQCITTDIRWQQQWPGQVFDTRTISGHCPAFIDCYYEEVTAQVMGSKLTGGEPGFYPGF